MQSDAIEETGELRQKSPVVSVNRQIPSQLVVCGGTVILPETRRCKPGDAAFNARLSAILPDDIGPVLLLQIEEKRRRPALLFIAGLLLFFSTSLLFLYLFFPRRLPVVPLRMRIPAPEYISPGSPLFSTSFKNAEKAYRRQDWQEAHRLLLPLVAEIDRGIPLPEATSLLYFYFNSIYEGRFPPSEVARARGLLSQLCDREPTQILWKIYYVAFNTADLDYLHTFRELQAGRLRDTWQFQLGRLQKASKYLQQAADMQQALPENDKKRRQNYEPLLDLLKCKVLVNQWLLEGGKGKSNLPDDQGDPGVEQRETAYAIASRSPYRNQLEFLQIRHFIVLTLKNQDRLSNAFFFKGREYFLADILQQELDYLNMLLREAGD